MDRDKLYANEDEISEFVARCGWEYGILSDDMLTVMTNTPYVGIAYFLEFHPDGSYKDCYWEMQMMDAATIGREELEDIIRYANKIWYEIEDIIYAD